jgi:putative transposase
MHWARILAYITGTVDQELLLRNEYLVAENRILKLQLEGRPRFSHAERATLGEIGHRLGRKALGEVANAAKPDTILAWYRKLVARKFDGSKARRSPGRPRIDRDLELLIVRMAKENPDWGYDRIVGALANLGRKVSDHAISSSATLYRPLQNASAGQRGRHSFGFTWRYRQGRTSSPWRCSRCGDS